MSEDDVLPEVAALSRVAWKPVFSDWEGETAPGGSFVVDAEQTALQEANPDGWPQCEECEEPLRLLAQLDLASVPAEVSKRFGPGVIRILACLGDCNDPGANNVVQRFESAPRLEVPTETEVRCVSEWSAFDDYPDWSEAKHTLEPAGLSYKTYGYEPELGTKLGGWPEWMILALPPAYPDCPECDGTMSELILQLKFETAHGYTYQGWLFQCPSHRSRLRLDACGE